MSTTTDPTGGVPFHEWTSCEFYGHSFEDGRCVDCDEKMEVDDDVPIVDFTLDESGWSVVDLSGAVTEHYAWTTQPAKAIAFAVVCAMTGTPNEAYCGQDDRCLDLAEIGLIG